MVPEILAEHFDLLADAPNGVKKLRELILQLAVRGKLVPQDPRDEPATELLRRVQAERVRLASEGAIRKACSVRFTGEKDIVSAPGGWSVARIGTCVELISGQHLKPESYNEIGDGHPYLTGPADFGDLYPTARRWTHEDRAIARKGDILVTVKGAGIGKTNILGTPTAFISRQLMAVRPIVLDRDFVHIVLKAT